MKASDSTRSSPIAREKSQSPLCLPDIPLPTPPPMANIMTTSRFDLQTRGGCGYRRILSSRSTEFRSPILSRSVAFYNNKDTTLECKSDFSMRSSGSCNDFFNLSPLPRHRNLEDLSKRLQDFDDCSLYDNNHRIVSPPKPHKSKYITSASDISQELQEVSNLVQELRHKFRDYYQPNEISPEQSIFYNEHYMSDIDENEEIKQFSFGYKTVCRFSDNLERTSSNSSDINNYSYSTLPAVPSLKLNKNNIESVCVQSGSNSSFKSSDFCQSSPQIGLQLSVVKSQEPKIMKPPERSIVKMAKISHKSSYKHKSGEQKRKEREEMEEKKKKMSKISGFFSSRSAEPKSKLIN